MRAEELNEFSDRASLVLGVSIDEFMRYLVNKQNLDKTKFLFSFDELREALSHWVSSTEENENFLL